MKNVFDVDAESHYRFEWSKLGDVKEGREHLGEQMPVLVYRLLEYSMNDVLFQNFGIEKTDDGRYKVSLLPVDESSYRALAQSLRGSYQSSTHAIYFTVEDGKILKMDGEIVIYYSYWNGFDSIDDTIVITAIVDFT